jgi:hypothetical protein
MKKLTKAFFKKEIKKSVETGLNSFEAMEALQNEFPDYLMKIMDAHTDLMMEAL